MATLVYVCIQLFSSEFGCFSCFVFSLTFVSREKQYYILSVVINCPLCNKTDNNESPTHSSPAFVNINTVAVTHFLDFLSGTVKLFKVLLLQFFLS